MMAIATSTLALVCLIGAVFGQAQQSTNYCTKAVANWDAWQEQGHHCRDLLNQTMAAANAAKNGKKAHKAGENATSPQPNANPMAECQIQMKTLDEQYEESNKKRLSTIRDCIQRRQGEASIAALNPKMIAKCSADNGANAIQRFSIPAGANAKQSKGVIDQCRKAAQAKQRRYNQSSACCSVIPVCKDEYELTPAKTENVKLHQQVLAKKQECAALHQQSRGK